MNLFVLKSQLWRSPSFPLPLCGPARLPAVWSWCSRRAGPSSRPRSAGSSGCWAEPAAGATSAAGGLTPCRCPPDRRADRPRPPHRCRPGRPPDSDGDGQGKSCLMCVWCRKVTFLSTRLAHNSSKAKIKQDLLMYFHKVGTHTFKIKAGKAEVSWVFSL